MCATMRDAWGTDGEGGSGVRPLLAKSGRGEGERNRGRTARSINLDNKVAEYLIAVTSAAGLPDLRLSHTPLCKRRQKTGSRTKPVGLHSSHSLNALINSPQI